MGWVFYEQVLRGADWTMGLIFLQEAQEITETKAMKTHANRYSGLLPFGLSLSACLLFSTIHSLIYNWVFLPRIFPDGDDPLFITADMIRQYWGWPIGKILIGVNLLLVILPFKLLSRYRRIK